MVAKDLLPTDDYENIIKEKIEKSSGSLIMYSNNYEESIQYKNGN